MCHAFVVTRPTTREKLAKPWGTEYTHPGLGRNHWTVEATRAMDVWTWDCDPTDVFCAGHLMGTVYRRKVRICRTCDTRLDTSAARRACEAAGHVLVIAEQPTWWVRYQAAGRWHWESAHSDDRAVADALLRAREAQPDDARPPAPRAPSTLVAGVGFIEAAAALLADYEMNGKRSGRALRLRITKHLQPFFGHYRLAEIRPPVVRDFIMRRQASGASNATINRDRGPWAWVVVGCYLFSPWPAAAASSARAPASMAGMA